METIFQAIREERKRQDEKWGADRHQTSLYWLGILVEEVGEVAKAIIEFDERQTQLEILHCASVCVCWLEQFISENIFTLT